MTSFTLHWSEQCQVHPFTGFQPNRRPLPSRSGWLYGYCKLSAPSADAAKAAFLNSDGVRARLRILSCVPSP
jgi:hypothetical protein